MNLLLYEYTTGGGLAGEPLTPETQSLLCEGAAMISALVPIGTPIPVCGVINSPGPP